VRGVHRITVHRWFKQYSVSGRLSLLKIGKLTGRPRVIPKPIIAELSNKLSEDSYEFKSYKQIGKWVEDKYKISVKYQTLHKQVHYRMKAKLKVPIGSSIKKDNAASI
jgi:transposase